MHTRIAPVPDPVPDTTALSRAFPTWLGALPRRVGARGAGVLHGGVAVRAALAVLVVLTLAGGVAVAAPMSRPASPVASSAPLRPVPAPPAASPVPADGSLGPPPCVGASCRGRNPHTTGCDRDAVTVGQSLLTTHAWSASTIPSASTEVVVGEVQVRWSPRCRAGWALASATDSCAIGTLVVRRDDGAEQTRALPHLTGGAPSRGYTPMLDVRPGAARLVGLVAPPAGGRGLVRDSTGFAEPPAGA